MKKLLLGTMALIGLLSAGAAQAADMPVKAAPAAAPPPFSWTGFYIGVHAGGAWGTVESEFPLGTIRDTALVLPISSHTINGFVAGGQVGYNWQVNPWLVFGIEGQFSWTDASGSTPCLLIVKCTAEVNSITTVGARIGYAMDRTMIYIKGGVAWADTDFTADVLGAGIFTFNASSTRTGGMIGAGIEHAFAPNWSAKIEYNFMDFNTDNLGFRFCVRNECSSDTINVDVSQKIHLVKFGLNYRFNWGTPAAPVAARY
jgi:outer membrane immunogenic protein